MQHIFDMIIIGGGPAGYTAALYASRAGMDTLVVERLSPGGQMGLTGVIDNYPGFDEGVDGFDLGMKMQTQAERFGAKTEYEEVIKVDFSQEIKKIYTSSGELLSKTVVIATGANPRTAGLEKEANFTGRGVHYCAHCDGRFYKDKTVVVLGGGNSAVEDALYLSRVAKKVYIVHRRDTFRATDIYVKNLTKAENVEIVFNNTVQEIIADEKLTGVKIKNTNTSQTQIINCDGLFVSIGRKPATGFLSDSVKLDNGGYILADESTKTDVAGVFAVGDVRTKALRQIVTAVADGAVAVHFAEEFLK